MFTPEQQAAYIAELEAKIEGLQAENQNLGVEIERLKKEKGLTREDLAFNSHTGLWHDKSGQNYCSECLDKEKRNPLKNEDRGWRCTVCRRYYADPDRPPPVIRQRGSWQA